MFLVCVLYHVHLSSFYLNNCNMETIAFSNLRERESP